MSQPRPMPHVTPQAFHVLSVRLKLRLRWKVFPGEFGPDQDIDVERVQVWLLLGLVPLVPVCGLGPFVFV